MKDEGKIIGRENDMHLVRFADGHVERHAVWPPVKETKVVTAPEETTGGEGEATPPASGLDRLSAAELRKMAEERKIDHSGLNKAAIIKLLEAPQEGEATPPAEGE